MSTPISKAAREAAERYSLDGGDLERHFQDAIDSASHPPALQWTAERPKAPGWYWMRTVRHKNLPFHCYLDAEDITRGLHPDHQHAGPLPLPSEPQAKET